MNLQRWLTGVASALALFAAGCGGGGGIGGTGSPMGTMDFKLTDAPACGYDHVFVTVEAVHVHQSATAPEGDSGWQELVLPQPRRIDLLSLTNGVLEELGEKTLPAGKYEQLRLLLAENDNQGELENAVVLEGETEEIALTTPSAQQTGLKMNVDLDVAANQRLDVIIDFDACKSVVKAGQSGMYILKPVLTVTAVLSDAGLRVIGWIAPSVAASAPTVSVQASGVPVKSTVPDPLTGEFVLYPVPVGTYDLVVATGGHATAVMTGVPVVDTAYTFANSASAPIAPALAASSATASGEVSSTAGAIVRALQALTNGPTIEVVALPVAAGASSPFTLTLPVDAPQTTAYVANPPAVTLTPDAAAAGRYTIVAADGTTEQSVDIDFSEALPPLTFVFP